MKFLKRINIFLNKPKVFCIGMNKTGTTTMLKTFKKLNFRAAPQIKQEQDIGGALAETLISRGFISPVTANFFQAVYVDETGRVHLSESSV